MFLNFYQFLGFLKIFLYLTVRFKKTADTAIHVGICVKNFSSFFQEGRAPLEAKGVGEGRAPGATPWGRRRPRPPWPLGPFTQPRRRLTTGGQGKLRPRLSRPQPRPSLPCLGECLRLSRSGHELNFCLFLHFFYH